MELRESDEKSQNTLEVFYCLKTFAWPVISGTKTNKLIIARLLVVSFIDVNTKSVITDDWKHEVSITGLLFSA